jgi:hypothetical protein
MNLVHISSGVIRNFLEPCYLLFDKYISKGNSDITNITHIPPSIQNEVIFEYSEGMINRFDQIIKELSPDYCHLAIMLRTLIESLGRLFYNRLHDPSAKEARIFSFTIKDENEFLPDVRKVLDLGVKYNYFQKKTYSSKAGGGREPWYILNRRLCPVFKLDPTGFQGRISLTSELLNIACCNSEVFIKRRIGVEEVDPQISFFDYEMEDGDYDSED